LYNELNYILYHRKSYGFMLIYRDVAYAELQWMYGSP